MFFGFGRFIGFCILNLVNNNFSGGILDDIGNSFNFKVSLVWSNFSFRYILDC